MKQKWSIIAVLCSLFVANLACSLGSNSARNSSAAPSTGPTADGNAIRLGQGLDTLKSYRAHLTLKFTGQDEQGNTALVTGEVLVEADQVHQTYHHFSSLQMGEKDSPSGVDYTYLPGAGYSVSKFADLTTCNKLPDEPDHTNRPADDLDLITGVERGKLIKSAELVNGISTGHYAVSQVKFMLGEVNRQAGDVWIAAPDGSTKGGYVVKASGWAEGTLKQETLATGKATWEYTLDGINQTVVEKPAACDSFMVKGVPELPDSTVSFSSVKSQTWETKSSVDDALAFYQKALPEKGWAVEVENGSASEGSLRATKDGITLYLSATATDAGCEVNIVIP